MERPPASNGGIGAAEQPAVRLAAEAPIAIYSSPYRRALQTVEPKADRVGIAIEIVDDLRERLLGSQLSDDWERHTSRASEDFDYVLERWRIEPSHNVRASESIEIGGEDRVVVVNDETILMVGGNGRAQLLEGRGRGGMGRRAQAEDSARRAPRLPTHRIIERLRSLRRGGRG